ncbi:MAG: NfeD family protein [Vicinamibacteria bacterium]
MTVFWRYWLLQIPGWGVLIVALILAHRYFGLSTAWALVIFALWLVKDWAIYPVLKKYYDFKTEEPTSRLVGQRAVAQQALRPRGYVRLWGELWLAEVANHTQPVAAGDEVIVEAIEGLTLRVRRSEPH